jgi:hypothetical protein
VPQQLSFSITDDQISSLNLYLALPQFNQWAFSAETQQNEPVRQFPTIESFLQDRFAFLMGQVMTACPPAAVQVKLDAIKQMQDEIAAATLATNVIAQAP